jgi:transglutaminase-like putative cysteine protease
MSSTLAAIASGKSQLTGHAASQALLLQVVHTTTYHYAAPVALGHHLAHLQPLQDSQQQLLAFDLHVQPPPQHLRHSLDAYGNAQCHFSHTQPHPQLLVRATSRVQVWPRFAPTAAGQNAAAADSPAWDGLAQQLRYAAGKAHHIGVSFDLCNAVRWVQPSPHVPRLAALLAYARPFFPPGRPVAQAALALMQQLHTDFAYASSTTTVETPLAQVLQQRRGVCQDFAHLMIGALRMLGLPARYVSGYLLTQAPGGGPPLLGADASHAWLQVWCPSTPGLLRNAAGPEGDPVTTAASEWLDLDPTNNGVPSAGYVRVAVGRDFSDVTPLRGVIHGGGAHSLHVGVTTELVPQAERCSPSRANTV